MKHNYVYFSTHDNPIYLFKLDELKDKYYNILKEYLENDIDKIDKNFYHSLNNDGYFIIKIMETDNIYFFIELDRINNIFKDLKDEKKIIEILNKKIK